MSDDDDWFERALREDDEDDDSAGDSPESTLDSSSTGDSPGAAADRPSSRSERERPTDGERPAGFGDGDEFESDDGGFGGSEGSGFGESSGFGGSGGFGESDDPSDGFGESGGFGDVDDAGGFGDPDGAGFGEAGDADDDASPGGFADADPYDASAQSPQSGQSGDDDSGQPESSTGSGGFGTLDAQDSQTGEASSSDDDLFEEDFASAFANAPGGGAGAGGESGPAGGSGPADGPTGDEGFGGGGGGEFGMGGGEGFGGFGDSGESFDDEEFESSIPRIDLGIEGLDDMIQGGVPERSLITTIGSAGTGKTTFGLQFLHQALQQGENAVYITLEESHERIVNTATEKGWDFDEYVADDRLAVIDLDPIEMANSLTSIRNDLPRLVEQFGASRLVLDSVSLLEMMYDEQATRRNEVYDFTKSLKEAGVTTMLTSEASEDSAYASRHGIIEYLVDAVFILRYIRSSDDFRETRLAVEIQKIRDANHSREIKPYSITNEGISVYRQANIF